MNRSPCHKRTVAVIGGGAVDVACASSRLRDGNDVLLIERGGIGEGAYFGNAGCLNPSSVVPMSLPGTLAKVPGHLLDPLGLRLAGTVEFAGLEAPPDWKRADQLLTPGRGLFPGLASSHPSERISKWMGFRLSLPDSLPVIGRARRCRDVAYAFATAMWGSPPPRAPAGWSPTWWRDGRRGSTSLRSVRPVSSDRIAWSGHVEHQQKRAAQARQTLVELVRRAVFRASLHRRADLPEGGGLDRARG